MDMLSNKFLVKKLSAHDGPHFLYRFPNDYGASIVCHSFSYGGEEGLFELAVIVWENENDYKLVYDTPVTDDVLEWLTPADCEKYLTEVENLGQY